ncbi:glycosyl transferase [Rhodococcus sp. H29-C3]|uniref:glycosyl transferase n=1 Tax=Rhodococcus sp. H29-C3 TaxID=3046307 RepID=UPI0024B8E985|nr:glycosyl transferase [Rhodococcus sp. H29-C3]MDJ0359741.1 glycosyl transferase [Rhodococcus sp. H29-C3]
MTNTDRTVLEQPQTAPASKLGSISTRVHTVLISRVDRADVATASLFTVLALFVMQGQWRNLSNGYLYNSGQDQAMWEWFLSVAAHSVAHLDNPLWSDLQNYPAGVNMMANTAMFGLSIPLAPITLMFGPTVTWAIGLTVGLAGTAYAWYRLFARRLGASRGASALGGALCGFAPAMVSHANGHPNFVVLFLLPVIASMVIHIAHDGPTAKRTIALGLVVALQILLGEEPLLIFAISFGIFAAVFYLGNPRRIVSAVANAAKSLPIAAVIAVAVVAVPLWWQFLGPQSYSFIEHGNMGNDAKALFQFPTQSIGGKVTPGQDVRINATEENAYLGWPLLVLCLAATLWMWRDARVRAAAATAVVMGVLSLGTVLYIGKNDTGIELPWKWFAEAPLVESVLETRFVLGAVPALALILVLATDKAFGRGIRPLPGLWSIALALALLPLFPMPLQAVERTPTPAFFADGEWRDYLDGGSIVTVPLPRPEDARPLLWQIDAGMGFPLAAGYFVGPSDHEDKKAKYGAVDRRTALLLGSVQNSGTVPDITAEQKKQAIEDLDYWNADVVVLPPGKNNRALRATVDTLLGTQAQFHGGVWVWDVRALTP